MLTKICPNNFWDLTKAIVNNVYMDLTLVYGYDFVIADEILSKCTDKDLHHNKSKLERYWLVTVSHRAIGWTNAYQDLKRTKKQSHQPTPVRVWRPFHLSTNMSGTAKTQTKTIKRKYLWMAIQ